MIATSNISNRVQLGDPARPGYDSCTGCRVCVLPCPVWINTRDNALTLQGRAISLKNGSALSDLAASADACVLCGACEPVCPEGIDTVGMTLDLRLALNQTLNQDLSQGARRTQVQPLVARARSLIDAWVPAGGVRQSGRRLLLTGPGYSDRQDFLNLSELIARILGMRQPCTIASDDGRDLSWAREAGIPLDSARVDAFLSTLNGRSEVVLADGLLLRELKLWRPKISAVSLGEALLRELIVRSRLRSTDLLIIESRAYHAGGRRSAQFYTALRDESGCEMNLDLQRTAMATGWTALNGPVATGSALDQDEQMKWIIRQSNPQRIVVESIADLDAFRALQQVEDDSKFEVLHLAQLGEHSR
jgi:ferredoxin